MARDDVKELYRTLKSEQFGFVPRGEHHVHDVYRLVATRHAELCDDNLRCSVNCSNGNNQPEWQHVVRKALNVLKSSDGAVRKAERRGYWLFV